MEIPLFFRAIETSALSLWLRDSTSLLAYPTVLLFHTLGLVMLAGPSIVLDLRVLGVAPQLPLAPMARFNKLVWSGFWITLVSGTLLLIAYPTKAFTDPVFYVKMACVIGAMVCVRKMHHRLFRSSEAHADRMASAAANLARLSLLFWAGAIIAGKFIEYTYRYVVHPSILPRIV